MYKAKDAVVQRFKAICRARGMTPNELANISGITPSTVYSLFDSSRRNVSITTIKILCDGLTYLPESFSPTKRLTFCNKRLNNRIKAEYLSASVKLKQL